MSDQAQIQKEILKEKVISVVKEFVAKEGNFSLEDIMEVLDKVKVALNLAPISFVLKD